MASQPYGAPSFFPCNDRADNKATYTITVTTEADYHVVATGRPLGTTTRAGRTRWTFDEPAPTSSYLVSLAIGRLDDQNFVAFAGQIVRGGQAAHPAADDDDVLAALGERTFLFD